MPKQPIQLSDHFTYSRLVRFVLPCIGTMLFTSIYGIVVGLCVSNFVGKTAFAAVNLIMPLPMLIGTIGFMLGTGGSAIVGITLGEGNNKKADEFFSLFLIAALVAGIVFTVIGLLIIEPVAALLGEIGVPTNVMRGFAVISRAAGLVAHIVEEQNSPSGRFIWDTVEHAIPYVGEGGKP